LGIDSPRGLHAGGLVLPAAPDRSHLAHPDGRFRARPTRAALRALQRHGDDCLGCRAAEDTRPGPRHGASAGCPPRPGHRGHARRRDVTALEQQAATTAEDTAWRRLDQRMLLVYPINQVGRMLPLLVGVVLAGSGTGRGGPWGLIGGG